MPPLECQRAREAARQRVRVHRLAGPRRLPINDASHVRNALARFNQVAFEDEAARDRARTRLLGRRKKHGIVPIGFISAQLQPQRRLPKGHVTFLLTDIEGSTELLGRLEDGYASLLADVRRRGARARCARPADTRSTRAATTSSPSSSSAPAALEAALAIQRAMRAGPWPGGADVRLRIGLHRGRPTLTETGYVGLSVHAAARICFAAHGGQIVLSSAVHAAVARVARRGLRLRSLGAWRFRGLPEPVELFQVEAADLLADFPPLALGDRRRAALASGRDVAEVPGGPRRLERRVRGADHQQHRVLREGRRIRRTVGSTTATAVCRVATTCSPSRSKRAEPSSTR